MEFGYELAKGATERMLGVKLPIFMRIVLPGLVLCAIAYPFVIWLLGHLPSDDDHWWQRIVAFIVLVLFLGALISTLNGEIYKICEGRTWWPDALFEWGRRQQQARVERLLAAAKRARPQSEARYNELWYQLRHYPTNKEGDPEATHPTRLGNLLAAYEQYPGNRYGMDSIFFWTRIWLSLDADKKAEIDGDWSVADGFLTVSAICFAGGLLWLAQALVAGVGVGLRFLPFGSISHASTAAVGWLLLGFLVYRLSLPFHFSNGEIFKAIFDVYRTKVWDLTSLKPQEEATWKATWAYLQYGLLQCPNCQADYNSLDRDTCRNCGFGLSEMKRTFREGGKFPTE